MCLISQKENVLTAAIEAGVKNVVCLSTDKAAYPVNAMGTSKAMMEKVIVAKSRTVDPAKTKICCTRYGNVMCSRGSVIPLWIEQIKAGNPITITEPSMTRFIMSLDEAVDLVLFAFENGESGDILVTVGQGNEQHNAILRTSEQIPGETFEVGDRIKVFVSEVNSGETRGPIVSLSRIHPHFVKRLFELEIPEVREGTIVIKGVSREAGSRTKIAVESRDENVDAIGSCIGKNGMRIANILAELGNEKVDIIRYSDDLPTYVAEALSPAKVLSVTMEDERSCRVTVLPEQLSLAIGKEGQNAKLVARLTGCKIDIKA